VFELNVITCYRYVPNTSGWETLDLDCQLVKLNPSISIKTLDPSY